MLAQQERERQDDDFSRKCLFCKEVITGNRLGCVCVWGGGVEGGCCLYSEIS